MFRVLAQSRITINRHIDVSENYANNMRLYEATGCGAMLLTDHKDNLSALFRIGEEVVTYRTKEEAKDLIEHYVRDRVASSQIAAGGRNRTLTDHSYFSRMTELASILDTRLCKTRAKNR